MTEPSPPGSHAWCSDCPWTDRDLDGLESRAKAHSDEKQHLVHMFEPED